MTVRAAVTPVRVEPLTTGVLVIGGGLAGVRAALAARAEGARVTLVTKGRIGYCGNSAAATGGFAVALSPPDSPQQHAADTVGGGYAINSRELAELVCAGAPAALLDLAAMGFGFPGPDGRMDGVAVPGHAHPRSVRYREGGMWHLMRAMPKHLEAAGVEVLEDHHVVDLLVAAGGCGRLYPTTTNKPDVTGDGYAIALRAGCRLRDMEFIQFTPTAFAHPGALRGMTISGALLAQAGVRLLNARGERFMERYAPEAMENAVRSVVALAIHREVFEGRGTGNGGVFLDLTALPRDTIAALKPGLLDLLDRHGIDPTRDLVEIAPLAHHCIGGISVDGALAALRRLYVAGEALGGTHGANRLSSNSLTEANVTGLVAGRNAARAAREDGDPPRPVNLDRVHAARPEPGRAPVEPRHEDVRSLMGRAAGLERSRTGLTGSLDALAAWRARHQACGAAGPDDITTWLEIRNMLAVAEAIVASALAREESRGAHRRSDFPITRDAWLGNVFVHGCPGALDVRFEPLALGAR